MGTHGIRADRSVRASNPSGVDLILATDVGGSLAGPFLAACALLVVAGVGKITRPAPARAAARAAGLPVPRSSVVAFGLFEIGAGVAGSLLGGLAAIAVAAAYVALAVVAVALLIRAPATPCACLGSPTAVVTRTHVAINVFAAGLAVGASAGRSPLDELSDNRLSGIVIVVLTVCCVQLAMLALETLPDVTAAIREGSPQP